MSTWIYFATLGLILGTVILVVGMWRHSVLQQAKARLANDDAYRQTAEAAAKAQAETAASLAAIQASLADVAARLTGVEKVLKDVE